MASKFDLKQTPALDRTIGALKSGSDRSFLKEVFRAHVSPATAKALNRALEFSQFLPEVSVLEASTVKQLLRMKLPDVFVLSPAVLRSFNNAGIETVADLVGRTPEQLGRIKGLNADVLLDMQNRLESRGLSLGMDLALYGLGHEARGKKFGDLIESLPDIHGKRQKTLVKMFIFGAAHGKMREETGYDHPTISLGAIARKLDKQLQFCEPVTLAEYERYKPLFEKMGYANFIALREAQEKKQI